MRAKLLLRKWPAAEELDTDTTLDCKENIRKQCQPEEAHYDAEGYYRAPTAKIDEEETKLNKVIILCNVARSAFASLNPSHAKKSLICE